MIRRHPPSTPARLHTSTRAHLHPGRFIVSYLVASAFVITVYLCLSVLCAGYVLRRFVR